MTEYALICYETEGTHLRGVFPFLCDRVISKETWGYTCREGAFLMRLGLSVKGLVKQAGEVYDGM